jgi:hypothetical protein
MFQDQAHMVLYYLTLDFRNKAYLNEDLALHASHRGGKREIPESLADHNLRTAH